MKGFKIDNLQVSVYDTRLSMGRAAAEMVSEKISVLLTKRDFVNIVFAAAPSQNEFLDELCTLKVDWTKVNAFHMDEYIGLSESARQRFGNFLKEKIFDKCSFRSVHYLNGNASDPESECNRYEALLQKYPVDIVCMGIGENTHIAFNDPHIADFNDSLNVKVVDLDNACRQQQVNDGCFTSIDQVPTHALTLTIPALMKADCIFCVVPGERKADAVYNTLYKNVQERYPSTILRKHENAVLLLDKDSASKILYH